jgi:hypothetical protein
VDNTASTNVLAGLLDGTVEDTPTFRRGITQDPLFDSVDLTNYILSLLHIEIGVGNQLLKMLLDWIDMRLENIGEEELDIRDEYYEALMEYEIHDDRWMEWKNLNGTQLATLRLERKTLNNWADARQENSRSFILPIAEQNDIKTQSKEMTVQISVLVKEQSELQGARKVHGQLLKARKQRLANKKKDRRKSGMPIHNAFETFLRKYGVDRAAHHGGDLTGVSIGIMFNGSEEIFDEFQQYLHEENIAFDREWDKEEIADVLEQFKELFVLCDYLFSLARTKTGEVTEDTMTTTAQCIKAVMLKWQDLGMSMRMPKIHAVEDHLLWQMALYQGIGDFIEDFIEQAHQIGRTEDTRTRNMRDRRLAALSNSKWEWITLHADVIGAMRVKKENTKKRKRKEPSKKELSRTERMEKRKQVLQELNWGPNPITTPLRNNTNDAMERGLV